MGHCPEFVVNNTNHSKILLHALSWQHLVLDVLPERIDQDRKGCVQFTTCANSFIEFLLCAVVAQLLEILYQVPELSRILAIDTHLSFKSFGSTSLLRSGCEYSDWTPIIQERIQQNRKMFRRIWITMNSWKI